MREIQEQKLNHAFKRSIQGLGDQFKSMPWEDAAFYALWLAQTYRLVVHTTRFLGLCAGKLGPADDEQHQRVLDHITQERGHDLLALHDIKALGFNIERLPELPETSALYHAQYYFIERHGPTAHYGYSLCLEGLASHVGMQVTERLAKAHGEKTVRFIRLHSVEDVGHFEAGVAGLDGIQPVDRDAVIANLVQSCYMYGAMLGEIRRQVGELKRTA